MLSLQEQRDTWEEARRMTSAVAEDGKKWERAVSKTRAVAAFQAAMACLVNPEWHAVLQRAAGAFKTGEEIEDEDLHLVQVALETRVSLEAIALMYLLPELLDGLREIDRVVADCREAVLLLDQDTYYDLLGPARPSEPGTWWGSRFELDPESAKMS